MLVLSPSLKAQDPPELWDPPDNSINVTIYPTLQWYSAGVNCYHIQVSTDPNFGSIAVEGASATKSFYVPDPLSYNTTYYWRVASLYEDDCTMDDYGPFSEPFSFTTRPGDGDYLNSVIVPNQFTLKQNYPNPFNPTTTIGYNIPFNNFVTLIVYDVNGKIVQTLVRMD